MTTVIPRLVIAGSASSVGKTTVAAGLIAALRERGLVVQPFKCGPDYIDPSYHELAAGRPCRNLDGWMLTDQQLLAGFTRASEDADVAIIEGVMGLFDGSSWQDDRASTAYIAKLLNAPVVLIVDISGAARSAAISVVGCQHLDPVLKLGAVILNFAGSEGHAQGCAEAIQSLTGLPVVGWLPRAADLQIPGRHLGLVPGGEHQDPQTLIAKIAAEINQRFDLETVIVLARGAGPLADFPRLSLPPATARPFARPTLAVARDQAFCFYYPENLELLEAAGARIEFFSPLQGECPASGASGVYLGGGYPELHGPALSANQALWRALRDMHARDLPIYAECGGFMVLTEALVDRNKRRWPMAGLVPGATHIHDKLAAVGYRHARALHVSLLAAPGDELRAHEFRYSTWVDASTAAEETCAWQVRGTRVAAPADSGGFARGNLLASYLHIHFGQQAELAHRFVAALRRQ